MQRWLAVVAAAVAVVGCGRRDATSVPTSVPGSAPTSVPAAAATSVPTSVPIGWDEARPILDAHRSQLPTELTGVATESAWNGWVAARDRDIRARLDRGDEDSVVNFWLYGTSFTPLPRATPGTIARLASRGAAEDLLLARLDHLVSGLAAPGRNERLRFAREVVVRHGIDPSTPAGQEQARGYLVSLRERMRDETIRFRREAESASRLRDPAAKLSAYATTYRERGLSSDTSLAADFSLDRAFADAKARGLVAPGAIRRVAIVGPGLDFTDKTEGFDFYPLQTIQPFAVVDSLARYGLAADIVRLTTFDLSPRVNAHLAAAHDRARAGGAYDIQLPLPADEPSRTWNPDLVAYWRRFGDRIGSDVAPIAAPPGEAVQVRAVRVRPSAAAAIAPIDLNIVLARLTPRDDERFDLIVATNVLVYYGAFEQALALANIAAMLRPGGFFVTNYAVTPRPPIESPAALVTIVEFDRQHNGDTVLWYRRR